MQMLCVYEMLFLHRQHGRLSTDESNTYSLSLNPPLSQFFSSASSHQVDICSLIRDCPPRPYKLSSRSEA